MSSTSRLDRIPVAAAVLAVAAVLGTGGKLFTLDPIPAVVVAGTSAVLAAVGAAGRRGDPWWRALAVGLAITALAATGLTMLAVAPCGEACW